MVEGVEALREREGVLGQQGRLHRPDRLLDDLVEPRRLEHESHSSSSSAMGAGDSASSEAMTAAADSRSRASSFAKMLLARTAAYWRYGPLSPSKLRASSMSKAITLAREYFTMK